jgi:hypothetical protein
MSYTSFQATPAGSKQVFDCSFHTLATGIAPRHSDTVDVKFMIGGKAIVIALPHRQFAAFKKAAGRPLSDREAIQAAGYILKALIERGQWSSESEYRPDDIEAAQAIEAVALR